MKLYVVIFPEALQFCFVAELYAIRKALLQVQASIIEDKQTQKKYLLPSKIDQEAKQIYRVVGIKPPNQLQAIL